MESLPAPQEVDGPGRQQKSGSRQGQSRRKPGVPSVDECLVALGALPKLVALGLLSPAQANSARSTYQVILNHHYKQGATQGSRGADKSDLQEALKNSPHLANYFVGLLSDEEIEEILASREEPSHEV